MIGRIVSVACSPGHAFSKQPVGEITLLAGLGVEGDGHAGTTVQHRSRARRDPTQPNLRQVHLLGSEILAELHGLGHDVGPGSLGENICTEGIDLLDLPVGAVLRMGSGALLALTGLRNPCWQLDEHSPGLMNRLRDVDADGHVVRRAGVMAVVVLGGSVRPGDAISVSLPPEPFVAMRPV